MTDTAQNTEIPLGTDSNSSAIPQPFAGAITMLELIAEHGAVAKFDDGQPTPNSELCKRFARELRDAAASFSAAPLSRNAGTEWAGVPVPENLIAYLTGASHKVEGLGTLTDEDDGVVTLRFKDEASAQQFMNRYAPTVDIRDMPEQPEPRAAGGKNEEELALYRKLAGETLRADLGWQRYADANRARMGLEMARAAQHSAFSNILNGLICWVEDGTDGLCQAVSTAESVSDADSAFVRLSSLKRALADFSAKTTRISEQAAGEETLGAAKSGDALLRSVPSRALDYPLGEYWLAPSGVGQLAGRWENKPHQLVYELIAALLPRAVADAHCVGSLVTADGGDRAWFGKIPDGKYLVYTATPNLEALEQDANRWRAVLASARIKMQGSAGLTEPQPEHYAHFGMEIWSTYDRDFPAEMLEKMDKSSALGRDWLTRYADVAIEAQKPAQSGDAALLETALNEECPIPDNPHASVVTHAMEARASFRRGWNACLARMPGVDQGQQAIQDKCERLGKEVDDYSAVISLMLDGGATPMMVAAVKKQFPEAAPDQGPAQEVVAGNRVAMILGWQGACRMLAERLAERAKR